MVARDLNSMVSDSRNRSTSARCSDAVHGEQRNEKARNGSVNESEGRWRARERGVVDLATPPTAEHAATFLDGHATASGGVGAITTNRASPGETGRREGERMTCGGHM